MTPRGGLCPAGIFQCGPCPVKAVRDGSVYLPYDGTFVYAEVNADQVYWLVREVNGRQKITKLSTETRAIGVRISTKAVGQDKREDITLEYKYPEGDCPQALQRCPQGTLLPVWVPPRPVLSGREA